MINVISSLPRECRYQTYQVPYTRTYKKLEREEYVTPCGAWGWDTCVNTRYSLFDRQLSKAMRKQRKCEIKANIYLMHCYIDISITVHECYRHK